MGFKKLFQPESSRLEVLVTGMVVPDSMRCVQCGICTYHCPIGIDVRRHAWLNEPIQDSHCLTCGECVARCPRGVLSFQRNDLYSEPLTQPSQKE